MKRQIKRMMLCAAACVSFCALCAEIDYGSRVNGDEPRLYVDRYGVGEPVVISNGYLFVEFGYIPSPYHIQRVGQGVVANGILVNCLFRGDPPIGGGWRDSMSEAKLTNAVNYYTERVAGFLEAREAVFLYKKGVQDRDSMPNSEARMSTSAPIFGVVDGARFPHLFYDAVTNQPPTASAINAFLYWTVRRELTTEYVEALIESVRQDTQLLARVQAEIGIAPQEPPNIGGE